MTTDVMPTSAELVWSVKTSFVDYVEAMSDGQVAAHDGATRRADGAFVFAGTQPPDDASSLLAFRGAAQFSGHFGMLYVCIANPRVLQRDGRFVLSIDDDENAGERLDFALLEHPLRRDSRVEFEQVTLTPAGSEVFFGNYPAGTPLDSVEVHHDRC